MTFPPRPAQLGVALTALGLSLAIAGPVTTEAKKPKHKKGGPPVTQVVPPADPPVAEEPAPAPEQGGPPDPKPEKVRRQKEKAREKAREAEQPARNVVTPQQAPASTPEPAPPVAAAPAEPAETAPAAGAPQTRRNAPRRLRTRGSVGGRRQARTPRPAPVPTAVFGAAEDTAGPASLEESPASPAPSDSRPPVEQTVDEDPGGGSPVTQTVEEIVEVVPESVALALGGLLALSLVLAGASLLSAAHARRLDRQRKELLQEVGLLQTALLPPVPDQLGGLWTSVAYRPADGPGAGGDFYDALPLADGRAAFILGDVSGHGRAALSRTAFLRYTLRAYLEAGLEPRKALQVAGRVIDGHLDGDFATVVLAVHDPATASLTFACAGHPAPLVVGPSRYEPVLPGASPPLGIGLRTGLRQTTIPLAPGSVACLFTDGLTEARTDAGILGRPRLGDLLEELGREAGAADLLERVAAEARLVTDDMAACLISPSTGATAGGFRNEQLELSEEELGGNGARRFLEACGVDGEAAARAEIDAADTARRFGTAVLDVSFGTGAPRVEVTPGNVESIEAASRRATAAS